MNTPNSPLKLLKQKRSSALIDARSIEAQLTRLGNSDGTAGTRTNLFCIVGMFHDYIAMLDQSIHNIEYFIPVSKPKLLLSQSSAGLL